MLDMRHINDTSDRLNGYGSVHPASAGRVITLDPPYELPSGMDLRGIAGIILKREPKPAIADYINTLSPDGMEALRRNEALFDGKTLSENPGLGYGPHKPPPFNIPEAIASEITELASALHALTDIKKSRLWFPSAPATTFHVDGSATDKPQWRMTYAFNGAQTVWHTYQRDENTPMERKMGLSYPSIPEDRIGADGKESHAAEGALIFLWNSANALFHRTPDNQPANRFVMTLDANVEKRGINCNLTCPRPCR